jgi:hypothetical protein
MSTNTMGSSQVHNANAVGDARGPTTAVLSTCFLLCKALEVPSVALKTEPDMRAWSKKGSNPSPVAYMKNEGKN